MNRIPLKILDRLYEARRHASLENACFSYEVMTMPCSGVMGHGSTFEAGDEMEVDTFVKAVSKLHRDSWILPALDEIIAWAEGRD